MSVRLRRLGIHTCAQLRCGVPDCYRYHEGVRQTETESRVYHFKYYYPDTQLPGDPEGRQDGESCPTRLACSAKTASVSLTMRHCLTVAESS